MKSDDKVVDKRDWDGVLEVREGGLLPLPDDVLGEFRQDGRGPCVARDFYVAMPTNQLGELQLHPCRLCNMVFFYSTTYGWVALGKGSPLAERVHQIGKMVTAAGLLPS